MPLLVLLLSCWLPRLADPVVTCAWRASLPPHQQCAFTLALSVDKQEIENQYMANGPLYTRVLQYLNYDIAQDVYLRLPGRPDSVAALAASYPPGSTAARAAARCY